MRSVSVISITVLGLVVALAADTSTQSASTVRKPEASAGQTDQASKSAMDDFAKTEFNLFQKFEQEKATSGSQKASPEELSQSGNTKNSKITFNQYIATTAPPFEDIKPAPGVMLIARGIDRFDGKRAKLPLFEWTWDLYVKSEKQLEAAANYDREGKSKNDEDIKKNGKYTVGGHDHEITIGGVQLRMVPDQLFVEGPSPYCEEGSQSTVEIVESQEGLKEMNGQSIDMGREAQFDVSVEAEKGPVSAGASTTIGQTMMIGASRQEKEYTKSAKSGNTRSAFASITSRAFRVAIRDETSLSGLFRDAVGVVEKRVVSHVAAEAAVKAANETGATKGELDHPAWTRSVAMNGTIANEEKAREELEHELRMFTLQFGTDFITHADMGGKVTQTTSTKSTKESSVDNEALKTNARMNMNYIFYKANAQKTKMLNNLQETAQEQHSETFKEMFEGGIPSSDWHEWCSSTTRAPVPVSFITRKISDLVGVSMGKPLVAERLSAFIGRMVLKMEECEQFGQGLEYDKQTGKCKLANTNARCAAGQYKETLEVDEYQDKIKLMKTEKGRKEYEKCETGEKKCHKVGTAGEKICRSCPRGKHLGAGGGDVCKSCKPGTFAENEGMSQCQECPAGRSSNAESQTCPFKKGEYYLQSVTNDGWEDYPGHGDRNYRQACSLGQADSQDGQDDIRDGEIKGGQGWAYCDAKDVHHKVTLTHQEGQPDEIYQISGSTNGNYLGATDEGSTAVFGGVSSTYGRYWAYFGSQSSYWRLKPAAKKGYYYIESTQYNGEYLGVADYDDGDSTRVCSERTNCPWIVVGDRSHSGKCSAFRHLKDASRKGMFQQQEQTGCANWVWKLKSLSPPAPTAAPTEYDANAPTPPPTKAPTFDCETRNTRGTCGFWAGCHSSRGATCSDGKCVCRQDQCAHDGKCVPLSQYQAGHYHS
jgi:hypothetical protein